MSLLDPFRIVSGIAASLPQANIDTDVIMPKQFLKGITRDGLAQGLFHDVRFDTAEQENPEFILNRAGFRQSSFLITGPNFGCGSSREHAVWGLRQFGIRCIIGTSFASIFKDNCFRNALLLIELSATDIDALQLLCADAARATLRIDLSGQTLTTSNGRRICFAIDDLRRENLLNGRDAVGATLQHAEEIRSFEQRHWERSPWLKPHAIRS